MYKFILQTVLASLFLFSAAAQRNFPTRKLFPDPHRPGIPLDSSQIKLLQIRQNYTLMELTGIKDSLKYAQTTSKTFSNTRPSVNAQIPTISTANANAHITSSTFPLQHNSTFGTFPGSKTLSVSNACGTKASFTPGNDTTLFAGQTISFINTSQNADSYEWFNDVYARETTTDFINLTPAVGVTQIMLVAHRGVCTDTAVTYVVRNGTPPTDPKRTIAIYGLPVTNEWASCITAAKADGYLLAGGSGNVDVNFNSSPYFVRVSETGCILWSRLMPMNNKINVCAGVATYDSGFVVLVANRDTPDSSFLFKFDKDGNILWSRSYTGTDALSWAVRIRELSDHSLMIVSTKFTGISGYSFILASIDAAGGFRWQKKYFIQDYYYASFTDLVEKNGTAWVAGTYNQYSGVGTNNNQYAMLFKIDVPSGNLLWSRGYSSPNKLYTCSGIHFYKDGLILNGFADSLVNVANNEFSEFETLLETDLDGNIREGKLIYNSTQLNTPIGDNLFVNPDNSISLFYSGVQDLSLQPGFADHALFLRLDADKNILWQNDYTGYMVGLMAQAAPTPAKGLAMLGQRMNPLLNPYYGFSENLMLVKADSNGKGPDPFCNVFATTMTIQDMEVSPWSPGTMTMTDEILQVLDHPVAMISPNSELRYNCPDYVPLCSFLKLSGRSSVCSQQDTLEFIAHKDPSCADPVKWTYDPANIKTVFEDGGRTRLIFKTPGTYKILAEKQAPCAPLRDSILVTFAPTLSNFSLGGDTALCIGDSLTLRPRRTYSQYQWQDGSTDDSLKVKTAGQYFCMVTDSCGNTKSDTILIDFRASIPIDLGATRYKCATDSLTITPPPGFKQYDWSPLYNLVLSAAGSVILYPAMDTSYQLTVHDNGGCSGTTSLKVNVYPGTAVNLGNDTSICAGAHDVFSVGGNFQSYTWSNGSSANSIDVQMSGKYSVTVRDQNGCKSSDTIVLTVYPPPDVHITGGVSLCKDQPLVLDAGSGFANYSWQDGSQLEKFTVTDTGFYRVQVVDDQGCDGADTIHVTTKNCELLLVCPNAFTPNNDGRNDIFRLKYPGLITGYQMQIFNRWGQMVFSSSDPFSGWDGKFQSELQAAGAYVWFIRYTDHNGKKQKIEGSVVLIR